MLLIVGTIRLPAENLPEARPVMKRVIEASRLEDGCLEYGYAEDLLEPGVIHIKELWTDRTAFDRHVGSDHFLEWRAAGQDLGIGDRNLRIYEVGVPQQL